MLTAINTINPLYTNASAAKRVLGIPQSRKIEFVEVHPECAVVRYQERKQTVTRIVSAAEFQAEFERYRREGAKECIATPHKRGPWGELYRVVGTKGDAYYVEASGDHLACSCEDWHQHETVCKHGYAVLNLVGAANLETYLAARRKVAFIPEYRTPARKVSGISID